MNAQFVNRFLSNKESLRETFAKKSLAYAELVEAVIRVVSDPDADDYANPQPDPERIHVINDGDYQGTLLFVIGDTGYQPSDYWYVKISYGSCSGCDTLEGVGWWGDEEAATEEQVDDYMTLALHIVQGLKKLGNDDE